MGEISGHVSELRYLETQNQYSVYSEKNALEGIG